MSKKNQRLKILKWRIDKMTGYTAQIENGNITTGKDFLKLCTRTFGIAMDMRENLYQYQRQHNLNQILIINNL